MVTQRISILSETTYTANPQPGQVVPMVAITYQVPPLPPAVALIPQADLPDWRWRNDNPGNNQVPAAVTQQGREARMKILQARRRSAE